MSSEVGDVQIEANMESQGEELANSEHEVRRLKKQVAQLEEDLKLAAGIGKQLLGNNQDLSQQLETTTREFSTRIEMLEQEKHTVQLRLEQTLQQGKNWEDELEYLRAKYESQKQDFEMKEQTEHVTVVNQLKKQVASLQSEVEQAQLMVSQLEEKNRESAQLAELLQQELTDKVNLMNETCSEEMAQLHAEVSGLNAEKRELTSQVSDSRREMEQLKLSLSLAESQVVAREREVEEQQCQATAYYNALERSREEVQELKVQLDIFRMESQDQKKKGNSLFAEVEDRRVEAEKRMITLKVQNETLKKQYGMAKDNLQKLKLQMAALLQMSTGRADARHLERLQEQLNEARSEVDALTRQLASYKDVEKSVEGLGAWQELLSNHCEADYSKFVEALIKKKDEELERQRRDLTSRRLQDMARTQQMMEYERQVYAMEQEKERLLGITMKQRVRIDELELKYEPDKCRAHKGPKFRAEKLPPRSPPAPSAGDKENQTAPKPPRPLDAPRHIKAALHQEVIKDTAPSAVVNDDGGNDKLAAETSALGDMSAVLDTTSSKVLPPLRQKNVKKVTVSPDVQVVEIEAKQEEGEEGGEEQGSRKVRGSKMVKGQTIKVKPAQPTGEDGAECKVQ